MQHAYFSRQFCFQVRINMWKLFKNPSFSEVVISASPNHLNPTVYPTVLKLLKHVGFVFNCNT